MAIIPPPLNIAILDPTTGRMAEPWNRFFLEVQANLTTVPASIITGEVSATHGGTGRAGLTDHALLVGSGFLPVDFVGPAALNTFLQGQGAAADPAFSALTSANLSDLASGAYTPTLFNVTNVAASTAFSCQYLRVGSTVTVSGRVDVDPTAGGAAELGISLPIASNFANNNECGGAGASPGIAGQCMGISADATNDRAALRWVAVDVTNQPVFFMFQYRIL
jgi:hypothetical protein